MHSIILQNDYRDKLIFWWLAADYGEGPLIIWIVAIEILRLNRWNFTVKPWNFNNLFKTITESMF